MTLVAEAQSLYQANLHEPVLIRRITGSGTGRSDTTYATLGRVFNAQRKELAAGIAQQDRTAIIDAQSLFDTGLPSDVVVGDYLIDQDGIEHSVYEVKHRRVEGVMIAYELNRAGLMALKTRVQPISREFELFVSQDLGPKARSAMLAAFAAETIEEAKQQNKQVLGAVPPYDVFVDGQEGAPLTSVKPDGVIRAEFQLVNEALTWIYQQLETHSPRLTGHYASSHVLFADGQEVSVTNPPPAEEYVFVNTTPYARKIEGTKSRPPSSPQAPDGVYQAVATLARKFSNVAKVTFSYRTVVGGERNPAIIVRLR